MSPVGLDQLPKVKSISGVDGIKYDVQDSCYSTLSASKTFQRLLPKGSYPKS